MADSDISERLILVAGMHRSGTSALTRILNLLGAQIPEPVVPAFRGNEHGHWEPEAVVHMNDRFLHDAGAHVNTSLPIDPEWFRSAAATRAGAEIARYLRPWLEAHPCVVVKDPRIALLAPVWRRAVEGLGVTPRFVLPFRRPQEVAASLARRQLRFFPDEVWPLQRGVMIWLTHVVELERATRGALRGFIGFDELLLSWRPGVERVLRQIGAELPIPEGAVTEIEASVRGDARREFARDEDDAPPLVTRVLAALHACAADPAASPPAFDAAAAELSALRLLAGDYLRELERKAEGWGDLREEARRVGAERDEARGEVRRLQLRSNVAERATAARATERTRLTSLLSGTVAERLDRLGAAHAVAAARDEAERQSRRSAALIAAQADRAADMHRRRRRHAARLDTEAAARAELERALAHERSLSGSLRRQVAEEKACAEALMAVHEEARHEAHASLLASRGQAEGLSQELAHSRQKLEASHAEQRALRGEVERARAYAATVAQEKLAAAAAAAAHVGDVQAAREQAEGALQRLAADLREESRARAAAEGRATAAAADAANLRRTLSWRVTAPMRRIRARLG